MDVNNRPLENAALKFREELYRATVVYLAITLVTCLIEIFLRPNWSWQDIKQWVIINAMFSYPFYFANGYLNDFLNLKMSWNDNPTRRVVLGTLLTILLNLVIIYGVGTLMVVWIFGGSADYMLTADGRQMAIICLVIVTVITLMFYSVGFFKQGQEVSLANEKLRKEKVSAELSALKSQVNPHFLFNSFNVLSGLIDEDPASAQKFLGGLSKIYRHILENRDEDLVSLEEELKFAEQYIDLQQTRFEDSVVLNSKVRASDLAKKIPTLSLQMVLENAIKHNGFSSQEPLVIDLVSDNGHLVVKNNKKDRKKLVESSGLGLKNIRQRYELHNVNSFGFEDLLDHFTVKLPLI